MKTSLLIASMTVLAEVAVAAQVPRKVFIAGDVKRAGDHAFEEGLTAGKVLVAAGGFSESVLNSGNPIHVRVLRRLPDGKTTVCVAAVDTRLEPGDILMVDDVKRGNQPRCRTD